MTSEPCQVMFIEDVAAALGTSVRTIQRRLRHRTFPIAPLPALDKRLRWSRRAVEAWVAGEHRRVRPVLVNAR